MHKALPHRTGLNRYSKLILNCTIFIFSSNNNITVITGGLIGHVRNNKRLNTRIWDSHFGGYSDLVNVKNTLLSLWKSYSWEGENTSKKNRTKIYNKGRLLQRWGRTKNVRASRRLAILQLKFQKKKKWKNLLSATAKVDNFLIF